MQIGYSINLTFLVEGIKVCTRGKISCSCNWVVSKCSFEYNITLVTGGLPVPEIRPHIPVTNIILIL